MYNASERYQVEAANAFANQALTGSQQGTATPAPLTVASALARMEGLNERLADLRKHTAHIAEMIGGPRPVSGETKREQPPTSGAVGRLNEAADAAHWQANEIGEMLAAIHRALG